MLLMLLVLFTANASETTSSPDRGASQDAATLLHKAPAVPAEARAHKPTQTVASALKADEKRLGTRKWHVVDPPTAVNADAQRAKALVIKAQSAMDTFPDTAPLHTGPQDADVDRFAESGMPWRLLDIIPLLQPRELSFSPTDKVLSKDGGVPTTKDHDGWDGHQQWRSNYQIASSENGKQVRFWTREIINERGISDVRCDWLVTVTDGVVTHAYITSTFGQYVERELYSLTHNQAGELISIERASYTKMPEDRDETDVSEEDNATIVVYSSV